jgi:2-polyprenyl-6-hydroxyphenyl methylase / 3-demethylubiquinone-9 3-methyltransferase
MRKIKDEIYKNIDNEIYDKDGDQWWKPGYFFNLISSVLNPFRVEYAKRTIEKIKNNNGTISVLDVGCGGGLLSEEFARMGFITTGIDPSEISLKTAINHAKENNLAINYVKASGENIPFPSRSFDIVICCDVLEHVYDLPKVISEISRVLKKDGIFIYDTFNRTALSNIIFIRILQEWKRWAVMPPDLHVWKMFIKPAEIKSLLSENHLIWKEHTGMNPDVPYLKMLKLLHRRASGKVTFEEFGKKFRMVECRSIRVLYMGYAVKERDSDYD